MKIDGNIGCVPGGVYEGSEPDVGQTVSPAVLSSVFDGQHVPFPLNGDGSVKLSVYQDWLARIGQEALEAFSECSEIVSPII